MFKGLKIYNLNNNYRCSSTIVEASKSLISYNPVTIEKNIVTSNPKGDKILFFEEKTNVEEGIRVAKTIMLLKEKYKYDYKDMAILYRTNRQSRAIEDALLKYRLPYEILSGINFYARKEIKDILAFMKLVINPHDAVSFDRVVNIPKRGIGDVTISKVIDESRSHMPPIDLISACKTATGIRNPGKDNLIKFYDQMMILYDKLDSLTVPEFVLEIIQTTNYYSHLESEYDQEECEEKMQNVMELVELSHSFLTIEEMLEQTSLDRKCDGDDQSKVQLMTMHMSKGLEYPVVFLVGCNNGTSPHFNASGDAKATEEERRLFYVGMTRAKKILVLTRPVYTMHQGGGWMKSACSKFIDEIDEKYIHQCSVKRK